MTGPLLETKFNVPARRRSLIDRPRLRERMDRAWQSPLTLVSAPAGFGKSTLVTEWLATAPADHDTMTAWLSLDQRDNEPVRFWEYVLAALQTTAPGLGDNARALLQAAQPIDAVLGALLNDLNSIQHDVVLVLDDYHVIEAPELHDGMAFLLEHLPTQVHLVLTSRADPALPLPRLRARGELVEVRAADLRFRPDEAAAYLNDVMGLGLEDRQIATLEGRTEGWIAALQLAALSMQGRDDVAGFVDEFAGDDRYIVDYLVGEVLDAQPDDVRAFLLQTSILSRLTGSLCDAVTGRDDGQARLEALERGNLLVIPLDDQRRWYRYHHLFAEVLRGRLLHEQRDDVAALHRRAAAWHEQHGEPTEAVRHALAGDDVEGAAALIERAAPALFQARQEATVRTWLEGLPESVFRVRPVLTMYLVAVRMAHGEVAGVDALLADAERWVDAASAGTETTPAADGPGRSPPGMVVVDEVTFGRLPTQISIYRAGLGRLAGDDAATVEHGERALALADADDHLSRGSAAALVALARWASGDLDAAERGYSAAIAHLEAAGNRSDAIGCSLALADIHRGQGRLRDAWATYERGLAIGSSGPAAASGSATVVLRGTADMYVGMSEVLRERNDLDAADQHLQVSQALGEQAGLPQNPYRGRVALAGLCQARGDLAGSVGLLDEAERRYTGDYSPDVRPVAAVRARVWVAQGDLDATFRWARDRDLSVDDDLTYRREFEHLTLARALVARARSAPTDDPSWRTTFDFLERLGRAAEAGSRTGSVIESLELQALAHQVRGDLRAALAALGEALVRAEPEGWVRVFLDEGAPMAALLRTAVKQGVGGDHARALVRNLEDGGAGGSTAGTPSSSGLIERLSERELDVLRLLRSELSGPDIARELTVSLNTVRTHTQHIYDKLGVNSRRAAVRRAGELGLT